jgi:catechol 2,3-dioxygenase-like lactoylglutathione lyase family enzyme
MEAEMSSVPVSSESATGSPPVKAGEVRLEVVVVPVSDVDRAKRFYETLGWRLDADLAVDDGCRAVQLTPLGSACSIIFGKGVTSAPPGSSEGRVSGPAPGHADYGSFAAFSDPDGNGWLLQEIKTRLPGR